MKNPSTLEQEITRLEAVLPDLDPTSKEYHKVLYMIEQLHNAKDRNKKFRFTVSGDTIIAASVNILGLVIITQHERFHAISTKAIGFITKLKV